LRGNIKKNKRPANLQDHVADSQSEAETGEQRSFMGASTIT